MGDHFGLALERQCLFEESNFYETIKTHHVRYWQEISYLITCSTSALNLKHIHNILISVLAHYVCR